MVKDKKTGKKFYIDFLGCEKRKIDSEKILRYMKINSYTQITDREKINKADIVIFVSCVFNDEFSRLSKEKIRDLLSKKRNDAKVIISGCLPDVEEDFLTELEVDFTIGPRDIDDIDMIIHGDKSIEDMPDPNRSFFDDRDYPVPDKDYRSSILKEYVEAKNAFKIRVDWGCLSDCNFCTIKKATKSLKSKSIQEIKNEIEKGLDSGEKKFFITGGDVGAYGQKIGKDITDLLKLLTSYNDIELYIQEFNTKWLIRYFEDIIDILNSNMHNYRKLFLNVPIQSGSKKILEKMNRHYSPSNIISIFEKIRRKNHRVRIGSHFIVGFPGETKKDFKQTKNFVKKANLDFLMVFKYRDSPKAKSYDFDDKIDPQTMAERRKKLLNIQKELDIKNNRYKDLEEFELSNIHNLASNIEGWLTKKEGEFLHNIAKRLEKGYAVEIGSWKGKSTFYLASGLVSGNGGTIYSVDHHKGSKEQRERSDEPINTYPDFISNLRRFRLEYVVEPLVMDSITASNHLKDDIEFVFLDASHEYEEVKKDFNYWWPKLSKGGIFAFHDALSKSGVSKFADEILLNRKDIKEPKLVHEIFHIIKTKDDDCSRDFSYFIGKKRKRGREIQKLKDGDKNTSIHP